MSLLDQLWEKGPGKLQKHSTFSFRPSDSGKAPLPVVNMDPAMRVTRSITIMKPVTSSENETPPASPAGATPPVSPFPGGRSETHRFCRRSTSDIFEKATGIGFRSPRAPYDL